MTRIFTISILAFGLASTACSSSFALQEDSKPYLPNTLSKMIDKEEASKKTVAPWRYASEPVRAKTRLPNSEIGFASEKPKFSVMRQPEKDIAQPKRKSAREAQAGNRVASLPPKLSTPQAPTPTQTPARVLPVKTSPMKAVNFSLNDQSLQTIAERIDHGQPGIYLDVATVMSFPADASSDSSTVQRTPPPAMSRPSSQPQMRNPVSTNSGQAPIQGTTNVYRAPAKFDFASAKVKSSAAPKPANNLPIAAPNAVLRLSVIGPEVLMQDTSDAFDLIVHNTSTNPAKNIVVQMQVSEDLTLVDFDRKAFLNGKDRTVSWKIDSVAAGEKEVIRFRAVSASTGRHMQNVTIGMNNSFQGSTPFATVVVENVDAESHQRLEFEK